MTEYMLKLGLLAQDDSSEWMNILFIVVVAAFWAVGGLVKAAGSKGTRQGTQKASRPSSDGKKPRPFLQQLAKKAEEIQRAMEAQGGKAPSRQPKERPGKPSRPPQGHVAVRTGPDGRSVLVFERQGPQRAPEKPRPPAQPKARPRPTPRVARPIPVESPAVPLAPPKPVRPSAPVRKTTIVSNEVSSPLFDYTDPDALKRAILQYEILGKPMALRNPFERISVL